MTEKDTNDAEPWYRRRRFIQMAGTAAGTGALAGCSGGGDGDDGSDGGDGGDGSDGDGSDGDDTAEDTPTPETKMGGELKAGVQADVVKLDPHKSSAYSSFQVLENVYQKLTALDEDLEPRGQLASDWEVSDDGTTWTFQLREGVQFHPPVSRELTATDVVYSIERILDDETGSPRKSNFEPITEVRADDDYTVVFEFDEPYAPFLYKLTTSYVMPEGADDADDYDIGEEPVGTGPFVFSEHESQSYTLIEAFDDYWETDDDGNQYPYLDSVRFTPVPEGSARVTNIQTEELDWIDSAPRSQADQVENAEDVVFSNKPGTWYDYLGHNTEADPLTDEKVRQAISWTIDRAAVVQGARFGYGEPTQDPVPPASVWNDHITVEEPYERDLEKAEQLLEESSYDGETVNIMVGQQYKGQVNGSEVVQEQLTEVGIDAQVEPTEWGTMISRLNEGDFQTTYVGWIGFVDPDDMFYPLFHTGEKWNQTGYSNEEVDQLLEAGRRETAGVEERAQYYDDAVDIIAREAPYTFLNFNDEIMAWRSDVKGFPHLATGTTRFKTTWLDR